MAQSRSGGTAASARQAAPAYRIIYNWDGAPHQYNEYPPTLEKFLEKVYAPLKDTETDALFWCLGTHESSWPSKTMQFVGDSVNRRYDSVLEMRDTENIRSLFEQGIDPYAPLVKRGRELGMAVYPSIRMNDQHFWTITDLEKMQKTVTGSLTQFRKDHPEWLLGKAAPNWATTSWNMPIPEVREHRLQHVKEACMLADWDGVELDWQRHAFHLPNNDEYRLRYAITDLQRAIRRMTDEIAKKRGRPFYVAIRVAASLEACRRIGYDIETWAKEGLCDIIIGGGNSGTDPDFEIDKLRDLTKGTNIRLYPCWDFDSRQETKRLIGHKAWRDRWFAGLSQEFWGRGADGMYIFNWHANATMRRESLSSIGSPDTLKTKDKAYTAIHRAVNPKGGLRDDAERDDRIYGEVPVQLHRTLTGDGPTFHIGIHDDVAAASNAGTLKSARLLIQLEHFAPWKDKVAVTLDGKALGAPRITNVAAEDPNYPSDVDENSWLIWDLTPAQAKKGPHEVKVVLVDRDPRIKPPLVVGNVEFWIEYK